MADEFDPYSKGVEYQVTKVDPTDPTTKGAVYQVHKVDEVTAAMSGKFYRARVIKDPDEPTVKGKVYQIAIIDDPDDPSVKGKVFNAIITGDQEAVVVGPAVPPLDLDSAVADTLTYVKAYGGLLQGGVPSGYTAVEYVENAANTLVKTGITFANSDQSMKQETKCRTVTGSFYLLQARDYVNDNAAEEARSSGTDPDATSTILGLSGAGSGGKIAGSAGGASGVTLDNITRLVAKTVELVFTVENGNQTLYCKDLSNNVEETKTATYDPTALTRPKTEMCFFGNMAPAYIPSGGGSSINPNRLSAGCRVYYTKIWKNGVLVRDYVPAVRDSDSKVGFYDRISHTFVTATQGSLTAGSSLAPTPSDPMDIYCNNGALKILDKSQWTIFTNPTSIPGQGVFINSTGKWQAVGDRGAGCAIPLTIGKQYTLVIHKKTVGLGQMLRYGQSPQVTPTSAGIQLTDWYRGGIADGQIVSFVAKQPYLVMQLGADPTEAGMIQEAIEVLEAQGGDYTFLKYIETTGTQYIQTTLSGPARWVGAGQGTSEGTGSQCTLSCLLLNESLERNANYFVGSRVVNAKYWAINTNVGGNTGVSTVPTLNYAEYDITFTNNQQSYGTINNNNVFYKYTGSSSWTYNEWYIGVGFGANNTDYYFTGNIYRQRAYQNNVLVGDFIPAIRNSDNVVGMYDAVSGTFFENQGTGTFTAGPVIVDGEVLKLTPSNDTAGVANLLKINNYVDTQEILTGLINHQLGILVLKGDEAAGWNKTGTSVFRTQQATLYPADFASNPNNNIALCSHFKVTPVSANLATAINDGEVGWNTNGAITFRNDSITTLSDWTTFLATQYAAGTPVIVVYPLATAQDEVAPVPQTMQVVAGDNQLDIVQAGMSGLEVEVKYTKEG